MVAAVAHTICRLVGASLTCRLHLGAKLCLKIWSANFSIIRTHRIVNSVIIATRIWALHKMGWSLKHSLLLIDRALSLLKLGCVALTSHSSRWILKIHVLGAGWKLGKPYVEALLSILGVLVGIAESNKISNFFIKILTAVILLFQQKTATNIIFQIIVALFMFLPFYNRPDTRFDIFQLLKYLL